MNSPSIRQPGSRGAEEWRPSQATISALITFVEWSQGCVSLEIALEQVITATGARAGRLRRIWTATGKMRVAANVDLRGSGHAMHGAQYFNHDTFRVSLPDVKVGEGLVLSRVEQSQAGRAPDLASWMTRHSYHDLAIICLRKTETKIDFLDLCFAERVSERILKRIEWGAENYARVYQGRKLGLVTEAFARQSVHALKKQDTGLPILGPNNPADLTRAEWRVCALVSRGLDTKAIGAELGIGPATVRTHLKHIYSKTGMDNYHMLARRLVSSNERSALYGAAARKSA